MPTYRTYCGVASIILHTLLAMNVASAQKQPQPQEQAQEPTASNLLVSIPENVRQSRMVHVSPNLIVFDPSTRSATLEFSNTGNAPTEADVVVQLGYTYWQNQDTALLPPRGTIQRGHDTVVFDPKSTDRYAGRWISGVPTHIKLAPHETQRASIQITPPGNLPDGEYYARVVTLVGAHKKRARVSQDTKEAYMYPIKAWELPLIRDSVRIFYRQGQQSMGLALLSAKAELDTTPHAPLEDVGRRPLRMLLRLHLTGNMHFEGKIVMSYLVKNGDAILLTAKEGAAFSLHRDGIMRWTAETDMLPPGRYHVLVRIIADQPEFPQAARSSMTPIEVELPFDIPAGETDPDMQTIGASTGQGLSGGSTDPYWHFIPGSIDYSAPDALTSRGTPAVVTSRQNMGTWAPRTLSPEEEVNNGWIGASDATETTAVLGDNTMRLVLDLSKRNLDLVNLVGTVWGDVCAKHVYVNGKLLARYLGENLCPQDITGSTVGNAFSIMKADGLVQGLNVIDFVYFKQDETCDGLRVDFRMIFRETHDRPLLRAASHADTPLDH